MQSMTIRRQFVFLIFCYSFCASFFISDVAMAQDKKHLPTIGNVVIQTIPSKHYLQGGIETDFTSMGEPIVRTLTELIELAKENGVVLLGPVIHYYYGAPHRNPDTRFKMETGFFVPEDSPPVDKVTPRKLPSFKCATLLYIGTGPRIGDAWQQLYRAVRAQGLTPTDEERELYLYWEGVDSPNNIVQVQLGVE